MSCGDSTSPTLTLAITASVDVTAILFCLARSIVMDDLGFAADKPRKPRKSARNDGVSLQRHADRQYGSR